MKVNLVNKIFRFKKTKGFKDIKNTIEFKYKCDVYTSFDNVMNDTVTFALESEKSFDDKIDSLDYIITMLKIDMQSDALASIIYRVCDKKKKQHEIAKSFFPKSYIDKNGIKREIETDKENLKDISLRNDFVYSYPWEKKKIFPNILKIKKYGFKYIKLNHYSEFYPIVDMCFVYNGNHSIASGIYNKMGTIKTQVVDISPLFEYIYTEDGVYWYNTYDKSKNEPIEDFRVGLIFEIVKIREKLKKEKLKDSKLSYIEKELMISCELEEIKAKINMLEELKEERVNEIKMKIKGLEELKEKKSKEMRDKLLSLEKVKKLKASELTRMKRVEKDEDSTYCRVLLEKFNEGVEKGRGLKKLEDEIMGEIKGKIELGIKYNLPKGELFDNVKGYLVPKEKIEEIYNNAIGKSE